MAQNSDDTDTTDYVTQIAILNEVVKTLEQDLKEVKNKGPLYAAIDNYNGRIEHLILEQEPTIVKKRIGLLALDDSWN